MAEAVFENLAAQMAGLSTVLGAQGVAQGVPPYSGSPKKFKAWIKAIEKYALLTNIRGDAIKPIAFQSSQGSVSDFLHRYMRDQPNSTWEEMRTELSSRFAEVSDASHALMMLRSVKQYPDEPIQVYVERILSLAEDAYSEIQDGNGAAIERQLIGFFTDGILLDSLRYTVMKGNPRTLQQALSIAMNEQNLRKRFNLRSGRSGTNRRFESQRPEPMEVDHNRSQQPCFYCNRTNHRSRDCWFKRSRQANAVDKAERKPMSEIVCWRCNQKGHIRRNCKVQFWDGGKRKPKSKQEN